MVTQAARVDANNRIGGGAEIRRFAVELGRDDLLLERVSLARERPLDDEFQIRGQPVRAGKEVARENPLELGSHVRRRWRIARDHGWIRILP